MVGFGWTCPFCNRDTFITPERISADFTDLKIENAEGQLRLESTFIVCPNPNCRKVALNVSLCKIAIGKRIRFWHLLPESRAKSFPDYIPRPILDDYNEACLICNPSPKASATLSRRCIQGILRDYWKVNPGRLVDEIEQIKDKTDPQTWDAIESVRKVGNIGAHMEKDIDLIIDVEPQEALLLIGLIEILLKDWYIAREERRIRLETIKTMAARKDEIPKGEGCTSGTPSKPEEPEP